MSQIKKKFIADKAIDGSKILLQNNEALKALNSLGVEKSMMKFNSSNALEFIEMPEITADPISGNQVVRKLYVDTKVSAEETRAMGEESRIEGKVDQEILDRQAAVSAEQSRAESAEAVLDARLDVLEGADNVAGSVAKALKDAKDYSDQKISDLVNGAPGVLDTLKELSDALGGDENFAATLAGQMAGLDGRLDTLEGDETTSGSLAKALKDAKDYTDVTNVDLGNEVARATGEEVRIEGRLDQYISDSTVQRQTIEQSVYFETLRATEEEARIEGRLNQEISYRDMQVTQINTQIDSVRDYADAQVLNEKARAEASEQTLNQRIDEVRMDLSQEASDRQAAVSAEETRAMGEESRIEGKVDQEILDRQAAVSAEQSARESADITLDSKITAQKDRIDAILSASTFDKDSFAEIVQLINSVDTENDSAFASYVLSNNAALAAEEARAKDKEQSIESKIDTETLDRQAAVSAEQSARQAADSAMAGRLNVLEADPTTKSYVDAAVASEQTVRDAEITAVEDRLDILEGADTLEGSVAKAEKDAKDYADSLMSAEQLARQSADSALDARLDALELDPISMTAVNSAIAAEQSAREAADSAMDSRVDALEAVAHYKESFTMGASVPGYVELSMEAMANSTVVFVGRLGAIEGVDYSVSVVGGKTRITFTGELASGGASALSEGDKVHVKFMK